MTTHFPSRPRRLAVLLVLAAAFQATALAQSPKPPVMELGKPYPAFTLPKIDDRAPTSLSDFRGQKVLLIHFASW